MDNKNKEGEIMGENLERKIFHFFASVVFYVLMSLLLMYNIESHNTRIKQRDKEKILKIQREEENDIFFEREQEQEQLEEEGTKQKQPIEEGEGN